MDGLTTTTSNGAAGASTGTGGHPSGRHPTLEQALASIDTPASSQESVPAAAAVPEPKPAESVPDPAKPDHERHLKAFEHLKMRERALRAKEQEIEAKARRFSKFEELEKSAGDNPQAVLDAYNLSYDKLVQKMIDGTATQDEKGHFQKLRDDIAILQKKLEDRDKADEEKFQTERNSRFVDSIRDHTRSKAEDYKLLNKLDMHEAVFDHLALHYDKTGEQLSLEEASRHIETSLRSGLKAKISELQELQALLDPKPSEPPPQSDAASVSQSFSLSDNKLKSGTPTAEDTRGLSDAQRFELAMSKLP